jgi:glutathione S-transferase
MIKFYYHPSPNPAKVALFLEESGLDYQMAPVDTAKGEQQRRLSSHQPQRQDARLGRWRSDCLRQ